MAASTAALPAPAARGHEDDTSDLVEKTSVQVFRTPGAADTDPLSPITLSLQVRYHVLSNQASFQLHLRNVALEGEKNKKTFHLHIRLEDIASLDLEDNKWSKFSNSTVYRLAMVLEAPLRLIGPKSHGCEKGWLGVHNKLEQLRSLAEALHLTILLPTAAAKKDKLLRFCEAASTQPGLQSLAGLYDVQSLYGGDGGYVYVPAHTQAPAVPQDAPGEVPDRLSRGRDAGSPAPSQVETESGESTIPADTPPGYRDLPPERHCGAVKTGEAANEDTPDVITEAANLLSHSPHLRLLPLFETLRKEIGQLTNKLETEVKNREQLTNKLKTQNKKVGKLTDEVAELKGEVSKCRESQDEVEAQVAATNEQQELLEGRTGRLEEDYDEVRKQLPDIHCEVVDAVRDHIGDALQELVEELFEDMVRDCIKDTLPQLVEELRKDILENHAGMSRPSLKALIDAHAKVAAREHFARFQARFIEACKE
ncbi:hypothetical protein PG988_006564 [Apiospora saccharicola]